MKKRKRKTAKNMLAFALTFATLLSMMPEYVAKAAEPVAEVTTDAGTKSYDSINAAWEAVRNGGTITLLSDWNTKNSQRLIVNKDAKVTINLNGHIINRHVADVSSSNSKKNGETLCIENNADVTINGGDTTTVHEGYTNSKDGVWYEENGRKDTTINGGVIAGGYSTNGAGGIQVRKNASVTLNDVTIAGNKADYWGGDGYGGGIAVYGESSTVTLNNSTVVYNYAETSGGGVSVNARYCNINLKNESEISHNKADDDYGGGIFFSENDTKITLGENCKISENTAQYGGGIYSNGKNAVVKLDGSAEITGNTALKDGGGVYFNYSQVALKGGKITGNTADGGGGGVWLQQNMTGTNSATLANTEYTGNIAKSGSGGAIYTEQENTNISACTITDNSAKKTGGGVYIYNGKCSVNASTITGNTSDTNGGGVYVEGVEDLGLSGKVIITDNLAKKTTNNLSLGKTGWINAKLTGSAGAGSKVGITVQSDTTATLSKNAGHYVESIYFSDKKNQYVEWGEDRYLYMKEGTKERPQTETVDAGTTEESGNVIKGYFSFPSMEESTKDLSSVFYYSDAYFTDPEVYNPQLASMSMSLTMSAFNSSVGTDSKKGNDYTLKSKNVVKLMNDIGIAKDNIYLSDTYTEKPGTDTIGVAIGQKELDKKTGTVLVPVAVRGAGYESEWASNVTMGDASLNDGEHAGFADAANQVFAQVQSYIENYGLSDAVKDGKVKFWVTGFSRAGATANLTAKRLIDAYAGDKNEVYAYCMEAPKGAYSADGNNVNPDGKYNSIHNCINANDPVPKVAPIGMNFARYGVDYIFNDASTTKEDITNMKNQLALAAPDMAYDDYFHLATLTLLSSQASSYFGIDSDMLCPTTLEPTDSAPTNGGTYTDALLKYLQEWSLQSREVYTQVPAQDLRRDTSVEQVSFETALRLVVPIVFSKSDQQVDELSEIASQKINNLDMKGIYLSVIRKDWTSMDEATKKNWIWTKLWDVLVEPASGDGLASKLSDQELTDLKTAWPTLLDTVFKFVTKDYQFVDWLKFSAASSERGLNVIATLLYNSSSLVQGHYQEVTYSWLRSQDDNYKNEKKIIQIKSDLTPTVHYSLDKDTYAGDQILKLDTKVDGEENAAAIYYKLTTMVNGKTSESNWLPYKGQILLPSVTDDAGNKIKVEYKVETRAALADKKSETTSRTYTISPDEQVKIQVVNQNGDSVAEYACEKGKEITIPAPEMENQFFTEWSSEDITLKDSEKKNPSITIQISEEMKDTITIAAKYQDKIDQVEISGLETPTPETAFDTSAEVILKGGDKDSKTNTVIKNPDDKIQWIQEDGESESVVKTDIPEYDTSYKAVVVLRPETGVCEFASEFKTVTVNGKVVENPRIEKKSDGSYWIFCEVGTTEKSTFVSALDVSVSGQGGMALSDFELPDQILIQSTDGYKLAKIKPGTLSSTEYQGSPVMTYQTGNTSTCRATAEVDLDGTGVQAEEGVTPTVNVLVTLTGEETAALPRLSEDSPEQEAYKGTQTIRFADVEEEEQIYYKVEQIKTLNDSSEDTASMSYTGYDKEKGIVLKQPDQKGTTINYKVTAYTKSESGKKADSAVVTFLYRICNPYTVTLNYTDTGLGNPWGEEKHSDTYSYFPEEDVTIVAPEIQSESFSHWKDENGISLSREEKYSKSITVGKLKEDIEVTAVYNPVVTSVNLTVKKPFIGDPLPTEVTKCEYTIENTYDMEETFGEKLAIESWSPEEISGVAAVNKSYTAKISVPFSGKIAGKEMTFKTSPDLKVTVKDTEGNELVSEVQQTDKTLSVFCRFEKTAKVKAVDVIQPDQVTGIRNGTSAGKINEMLNKKILVKLSTGINVTVGVDWTLGNYDPTCRSGQAIEAEGTLVLPEYIDGSKIEDADGNVTVSTKIYVDGAEKVKAPEADAQSGLYVGEQKVKLSSETADATVHYTTDGTMPTTESEVYDAENGIVVTENTLINAIAVKDGMQDSASVSYSYIVHNHVDADGDGKCDGIVTGDVDVDGNPVTQSCDAVALGLSDGSEDAFYGNIAEDDGNGTVYLQVDQDDITEKTGTDNSLYPTTKLKYQYQSDDNVDSDVTLHDYLFAGWYKAEKSEATGEDSDTSATIEMKPYTQRPTETAYAKFVDASALDVKAQITAGTTSASKETNMRFITTADSKDYQEIGLEITYNNTKTSHASDAVQTNIYAFDGTKSYEVSPQQMCQNHVSQYFMTWQINHISKDAFDDEFKVSGYWITLDGTKVYGSETVKKVNDAPELKEK